MLLQLAGGLLLVYLGIHGDVTSGVWFGLALVISYPIIWAHVLAIVIALGRVVVIQPREKRQIREAHAIFSAHPGLRVAIAGSYGKTSMKELLQTVLAEGKNVAATPANMNVLSSHARFARSLKGDEDVVLIEFGEGKPGDVKNFTSFVQPTDAVITGLAPAHLDRYRTLAAAGEDIFSVATAVPAGHAYVNVESITVNDFRKDSYEYFDRTGALGWSVSSAITGIDGTSFELTKGSVSIKLHSQLIGLHQVGPLAFAAALGLKLGLTEQQIVAGIAQTKPFEHRMQPYQLTGAWIIDDTYNGNLEGIRAGTKLLADLTATRKVYVTPGLVDQGKQKMAIHQEVGELIAAARPDMVVLMQNSVVDYIKSGLVAGGYTGEVIVQDDPLDFYQHLDHFVVAGDVVLMQNDWTDNYQ
jgi:UDP-N-acetylmuramyl pentapeptide synthase